MSASVNNSLEIFCGIKSVVDEKAHNDLLHKALVDAEEELRRFHVELTDGTRRSREVQLYEMTQRSLRQLELELSYANLARSEVSGDEVKVASKISPRELERAVEDARASDPVALEVLSQVREESNNSTSTVHGLFSEMYDQCFRLVIEARLDSYPWKRVSEHVAAAEASARAHCKEIVTSESVKRLNARIALLSDREKELRRQEDEAYVSGDVDVNESAARERVVVLQQLFDLAVEKISASRQMRRDYVEPLIHELEEKIRPEVKLFGNMQKGIIKTQKQRLCDNDYAMRVQGEHTARAADLDAAEFATAIAENDSCLSEIDKERYETWERISKLEHNIANLEVERSEIIAKRLKIVDAEKKRRAYAGTAGILLDARSAQLELYGRYVDARVLFTDLLSNLLAAACDVACAHVSDSSFRLEELAREAHLQHLDFFRRLFIHSGRCLARREWQVEELLAHLDVLKERSRRAVDSSSISEIQQHSTRITEVKKKVANVRCEIAELRRIMKRSIDAFGCTEAYLEEKHMSIPDVFDELRVENQKQGKMVVRYHFDTLNMLIAQLERRSQGVD